MDEATRFVDERLRQSRHAKDGDELNLCLESRQWPESWFRRTEATGALPGSDVDNAAEPSTAATVSLPIPGVLVYSWQRWYYSL